MYDLDEISARIAKLRDLRGITEREYRDRSFSDFQASLVTMAPGETSKRMNLEYIMIAADILGTSVDYLLGRTIDPRPGLKAEDVL